jgi:hypothetical protein
VHYYSTRGVPVHAYLSLGGALTLMPRREQKPSLADTSDSWSQRCPARRHDSMALEVRKIRSNNEYAELCATVDETTYEGRCVSGGKMGGYR